MTGENVRNAFMKKSMRVILTLIITLVIITLAACVEQKAQAAPKAQATQQTGGSEPEVFMQDKMEVHFIDVGQGDSTLIKCGDHSMLIDTGDDTKGTAIQNYLKKQSVKKLDYLILTHPDSDHIGGAPVIITKFEINKVFISNYEKDNKTYRKLIQALDDKKLSYSTPKVGYEFSLGSAAVTILAPDKEYDNPNDASIALIVKNGDNKFLFTGDAEAEAEKDISNSGFDITADVYKVGHHGSRTSTSAEFMRKVKPKYAVISCAEGNSYGHPHAETLNTLRARGVKLYRTDEEGSIIATSDGKDITFNVPPSDTWNSGEPTESSAKSSGESTGSSAKSSGESTGSSAKSSGEPTGSSAAAESKTAQAGASGTTTVRDSAAEVKKSQVQENASDTSEITYILNVKTKKFHRPSCSSLPTTNRKDTSESRDSVIAQGYEPCKRCNP